MNVEKPTDILDHTIAPDEDEEKEQTKIRLKRGFEVRELLDQKEGVTFEPDLDLATQGAEAEGPRNYFFSGGGEDEVQTYLDQLNIDDDEDENDDPSLSAFERKAKRMTDVTEDGGVKKRIIKAGVRTLGKPPAKGTVTLHFSCYLEDQDEPYDSTILRGRAERFRLDDGRLLPGIEAAVKTMDKKEEAEFLIEPGYAFGHMGCPPRVPKDAKILAKITMLEFAEADEAEAVLSMDVDERRKAKTFDEIERIAKTENKQGHERIQLEDFRGALRRYEQGVRLLEDVELRNDDDEHRQRQLLQKLRLNRAFCLIKLGIPKKACSTLQRVLESDNKNTKALYRMGKAKQMLGNYDDALRYLKRAQRQNPTDTSIGTAINEVEKTVLKEHENQKAIYQRMFRGGASNTDEEPATKPAEDDKSYMAEVDDEIVEDLYNQLEAFKKESSNDPLVLPSSFSDAEIKMAGKVAANLGMNMEQRTKGKKTRFVISKQ